MVASETPGFALPEALRHLAEGISQSRGMLDWLPDWDEAGSPRYAEDTWNRALTFLTEHATQLWDAYGVRTDSAELLPGSHGSIDLDWRVAGHELLVNFPADPREPIRYYGDDGHGRETIKGAFNPALSHRWLLAWLAE